MSGPASTAGGPSRPAEQTGRVRKTAPSAGRAAVETVVISVAVGLLVGVAWRLIAPEVVVEVTDGNTALLPLEARRLFTVDAWFAILGGVAGLLVTLVMFTRHRHRHRPLATLAGLVAGGVLGSFVAWRLGRLLGPEPLDQRVADAADGARLPLQLDLEATGVLLVWPVVAVVAVLVITALSDDHTPWRRPRPDAAPISPDDRSEPWSPL